MGTVNVCSSYGLLGVRSHGPPLSTGAALVFLDPGMPSGTRTVRPLLERAVHFAEAYKRCVAFHHTCKDFGNFCRLPITDGSVFVGGQ